jgi:hypothetical protein
MEMITWNMTEVVDTPVNVTLVFKTSRICWVPDWQCCSETKANVKLYVQKFNYFKFTHNYSNKNNKIQRKCLQKIFIDT